ncbi:MAG: hypothetical protein M3Y81_11050 [Chloroflexota bacterium]|nr:hypothetical protein [Chloroflexota bacterium]
MHSRRNTTRSQTMSTRQTVGLAALVFTSVLPALLLTGFFPSFGILRGSFPLWIIVALLGGALGGGLMTPNLRYWYVGGIAGILIGPGMLIATYYYTAFRSSFLAIEIVIPMVIGALPGLLFLVLVTMLSARRIRAQRLASRNAGQGVPAAPYPPGAYQPQSSGPTQTQQPFQPYYAPPQPSLQPPASQQPPGEEHNPQRR